MDAYIGRLLDNRYEILEIIGTGGMAVVYKALDHRLNRLVAVKILKDEFSRNEEFRRRFQAESQAVAMVSHPNIVGVYDVSRTDELDYIVMELIEGITLKQYLERKGNLNWRETLHFSIQIAKALEHAHSRGIVHRDIKPHNIMILKDGSIKVADFGIARIGSAQNTLTREALGSVHYISPEQAKGARVDNRSDLYSLGVVMYEMLTGRTPYDGDTPVSVAIQHINGNARCPSELMTGIPLGLEQITMHAMSANPDTRYASATDMLRDMEEFRKNPTITFHFNGAASQPEAAAPAPGTAGAPAARQPRTEAERYAAARRGEKVDGMTAEQRRAARARRTEELAAARRRKNLTIAIIAAAAVVVILVVVLIVVLTSGGDKDPDITESSSVSEEDTVVVDDFVGTFLEDIDPEDYPDLRVDVINVREENSSKYDKGYVIDQSPEAGEVVKKGRTVTLTVSLGKSENVIPDYKNMTGDELMKYLSKLNLGLKIETKEVDDEKVVRGYVVRTEPAMGEELSKNQNVIIYVSLGSNKMPDFIGEVLEDAQKKLNKMDLKLKVDVEEEYSETVNEGCIISTNPRKDSPLHEGDRVTLTVSLGSNKMPDLTGQSKTNAQAMIDAMDMGLRITFMEDTSEDIEEGKVIRTEPKAGSSLKKNDQIKVFISTGKPVELVQVPGGLIGKTAREARAAIEAQGLVCRVSGAGGDESMLIVIAVTPGEGAELEKGSEVIIEVVVKETEPPATEPPKPTETEAAPEPAPAP